MWKSDAIQTPSSMPDHVKLVNHFYTQRESPGDMQRHRWQCQLKCLLFVSLWKGIPDSLKGIPDLGRTTHRLFFPVQCLLWCIFMYDSCTAKFQSCHQNGSFSPNSFWVVLAFLKANHFIKKLFSLEKKIKRNKISSFASEKKIVCIWIDDSAHV